jgi:hypothetical protein
MIKDNDASGSHSDLPRSQSEKAMVARARLEAARLLSATRGPQKRWINTVELRDIHLESAVATQLEVEASTPPDAHLKLGFELLLHNGNDGRSNRKAVSVLALQKRHSGRLSFPRKRIRHDGK